MPPLQSSSSAQEGSSGMFHSECPACGAPVRFKSAASAFAICGYCHSHLSRDLATLASTGLKSEVLEDYSVLQLQSHGEYEGQAFELIGRIQIAYDGGGWNEWYVLFSDGRTGWLSDASGQYAMLFERSLSVSQPYESLQPGDEAVSLGGRLWTVTDKREAQCVGAQGELPFPVYARWTTRVVDLRAEAELMTLDYGFSGEASQLDKPPTVYRGASVTLSALNMKYLRDETEVGESAGRMKGKLCALTCAGCGGSLTVVIGASQTSCCPSCGAVQEVTGPTAKLINTGIKTQTRLPRTLLQVGRTGFLEGKNWTVIGAMEQVSAHQDERYAWTDYLLYNASQGFSWLSESKDGKWLFSTVVSNLPVKRAGELRYKGERFVASGSYTAKASAVWGSFNWRVKKDEETVCREYKLLGKSKQFSENTLLVQELTNTEMVWSLAQPIADDIVRRTFGVPISRKKLAKSTPVNWALLIQASLAGHLFLFFLNPTILGFYIGVVTLVSLMTGALIDALD